MNGNEEKPAWRQALGRLGYLGASALAEVPETLGALAGGFGALRSMTRASPRGASPGPLANYEAVSQSMPLVPEAQALRRSAADYAVRQGVPRGDLIMGELLAPDLMPGPLGDLAAIKMLHASPHRFRRFDMSKMGSGQGAAAYGRGAYFSHPDAPAVHKSYFEEFSEANKWEHPIRELRIRGERPIYRRGEVMDYSPRPGESSVRGTFVEDVLMDEAGIRNAYDAGGAEGVREMMLRHARELRDRYADEWQEALPEVDDLIRKLERSGAVTADMPIAAAQSYAVDIDVDPEDLLDYDAPLSQQSEKVQRLIQDRGQIVWSGSDDVFDLETAERIADSIPPVYNARVVELGSGMYGVRQDFPPGLTGRELVESVMSEEGLREAGIPGLRYADYGSRGGQGGTYNVVMFPGSEELIGEMQPGPLSSQMPKGGLAK